MRKEIPMDQLKWLIENGWWLLWLPSLALAIPFVSGHKESRP
jgi:hypothetical protein